jgi:hypothetical protein
MAIESHIVTPGSVSGSRQNFTYDFYFGGEVVYSVRKLLPIGFDTDSDALSMYDQVWESLQGQEMGEAYEKAENRQNPDLVPSVYNPQVDFDRKLLGYVMTIEDPHKLNACLPFWQAVQPRNGNNRAQRIANLGVPDTEYDEVAARFNDYFGVATFLSNDLSAIWPEVKEAWE